MSYINHILDITDLINLQLNSDLQKSKKLWPAENWNKNFSGP